jgi:hypothetical protein
MGGIVSKPKAPPPPAPVEADVSAREKAAERAEAKQKQELSRRVRARATGGRRQLISQARQDAELGVPFGRSGTLGYTRNV